jgi:hypothetical protein
MELHAKRAEPPTHPVEDAVTERDAMSMSPQPIAEWEDGKPWPDEHARWWLCRKCHRAYASPTTGKPPAHCICFNESGILVTEAPSLPSDAVTRAKLEVEACIEPDGEVGIDFDYGPRSIVSLSIGEKGMGFAALIGGFSASGRKQFDHPLPSNVLDFLRAHLKGSPDAD